MPFNLVIPGCALLGADPESSTMHCSGFRVRSPSDKIDEVNFAQGSRPGMTVSRWMRGSSPRMTQLGCDSVVLDKLAVAQSAGMREAA
jgi:hypothetical protein